MKLEKQVVSLELAKRLKELGVKQESYFLWYGGQVLRENQLTQELRRHEPPVPAYTTAKLGEMLPKETNYQTTFSRANVVLFNNNTATILPAIADTEADARAKMFIYLLENNLITIEANN